MNIQYIYTINRYKNLSNDAKYEEHGSQKK